MAQIAQNENRWKITGDILMDSANTLLLASKSLTIANDTQVDFVNVTEVDTSAVSLMLEWHRRAITENQQLKFVNLPASLATLTELYGVADLID